MSSTLNTLPPRVDLIVPRNAQQPFTITVSVAGTPVDLTGETLTFMLKANRTDADSAALLVKDSAGRGGITLTDPTLGKALLSIEPGDLSDTTAFPEGIPCFYGINLYTDAVEVVYGAFTVISNVIVSATAP